MEEALNTALLLILLSGTQFTLPLVVSEVSPLTLVCDIDSSKIPTSSFRREIWCIMLAENMVPQKSG